MFDTMTFTKIMGGFCGALLVFLLGKWAAEEIYAMGDHGYGEHSPAYVIDTGSDDAAEEEEEEVITLASLYADADPDAGERVFNKCAACHKAEDGANGVGPHLYGVVGRDIGGVDGYGSYSGVLSEVADVWTPENLYAFLEDPSGWAPGTSMGYAGLKKPEDRADVIAYLDLTDGDMTEVAAAATPEAAPAEETAETQEPAAEDAMGDESAETAAAEDAPAEEEMAAADTSAEGVADAAAEAGDATAEAGASGFAAMVAAADPADGEQVYRKCAACHVLDEPANRVGPHLVDIVGREIAAVDGFNYSDALAGMDGVWDADALSAWLENPNEFAPGNKMSFRGLNKEEDRAAIIKYMQSVSE